MKKIIAGVSWLCLFTSNAYAFGNGIYINGLQINPGVAVTSQYADNITTSEAQRVSSSQIIFQPTIEIIAGDEINRMEVRYDFVRGNYISSPTDSFSDHIVFGSTHNELTSKAVVDTTVSYAKSHDARGTTFSGIATGFNAPDLWHETGATAGFSYGGAEAIGRIAIHGGFAAKRYDNHRSLTAARDLNTSNAGATFYYRIMSKTSLLFEGDYANFDYRLATSLLDSYELTAYTGLTWEATEKTTGTVKAGWQRKKFKRGTFTGGGFFSLDANVSWSPLTYSTWTLDSSVKATETDSNGVSGDYIKVNDVLLDWTHEWNDRLSHSARIGYRHDSYVGTARKDDIFISGFDLNYDFSLWLRIGAAYDYVARTSNAVNASYHSSVYSVVVTGTL